MSAVLGGQFCGVFFLGVFDFFSFIYHALGTFNAVRSGKHLPVDLGVRGWGYLERVPSILMTVVASSPSGHARCFFIFILRVG